MKNEVKKIKNKHILILISIVMALPSILYLIANKTIVNFKEWFTFFLKVPNTRAESVLGAIVFGILLILAIYFYFRVIKDSKKEFKNFKTVILYVLIISIIFAIMIPFTTSDIFYYIGTRMA